MPLLIVVPAVQKIAPEIIVGGGDTMPMKIPAHPYWTCEDKRMVLMTTEGGAHLCVQFPDLTVAKGL